MSLSEGGVDHVEQHKKCLKLLRETGRSRIQFEDELPPSWDALWQHWLRTCWGSNMWSQAAHNQMTPLDLSQYGWNIVDYQLECDWDSDENRDAVGEWVELLFRGCSCPSVTACSTRQCGCVKKNVKCGPGCRCKHCGNCLVATSACTTPGTQPYRVVRDRAGGVAAG